MRNAIETKNLTKVYKNFTAVNSLNLKVPEKKYFWITWSKWGRKNHNN